METMATRKYEQTLRAEAAENTRLRILDAVHERLRAAPAEQVNLDQIAKLARVARPTIYTVFGSRAGLFSALAEDLLHRGGFDRVSESALHPDPVQGMHDGIAAIAGLYAAHREVLRSLFSMAMLDAEAIGDAVSNLEDQRSTGMNDLARRLGAEGVLRPDVDVEVATDILWVLTSFDSFDLLFTGRRLSAADAAATITSMAVRTICRT